MGSLWCDCAKAGLHAKVAAMVVMINAHRMNLPYGPADARSRNHAMRNNKEQQRARRVRSQALVSDGSRDLRRQHHCDIRKVDPHNGTPPTGVTRMNKIKLALLVAGLLTSLPVLAQTAGGTENTGPQGTGNFVAGQTERYGVPVAGKPEGTASPVAGQPTDKMNEIKKIEKK
jgi:hypothetical protein